MKWESSGSRYANALIIILQRYWVLSSWFLFLLPAGRVTDEFKSEQPDLSFPFAVSEHRVSERLQYVPRSVTVPPGAGYVPADALFPAGSWGRKCSVAGKCLAGGLGCLGSSLALCSRSPSPLGARRGGGRPRGVQNLLCCTCVQVQFR